MLDAVAALPRPPDPALRWTSRGQWHVTLRFLGDVDERSLPSLEHGLREGLEGVGARQAAMGPSVAWLGRPRQSQLVAPVAGLDDLAAEVAHSTRDLGRTPERRAFQGHLTLARVRRGRRSDRATDIAGHAITAAWTADRIAVVRSHLSQTGAEYETLVEVRL